MTDEDQVASMRQLLNYADECQSMIYFLELKEDFQLIDPYKHFKEKWIIDHQYIEDPKQKEKLLQWQAYVSETLETPNGPRCEDDEESIFDLAVIRGFLDNILGYMT